MMGHNDSTSVDMDLRTGGADPGQQSISPKQINDVVDGAARMMDGHLVASVPMRRRDRSASAQALQEHIDRRMRLAEQIRAEHPAYTEAELEERLELFGA
jgi:hypothetical protein